MDQPDSTAEETETFSRDAKPWNDLITHAEKSFRTYQDKADSIDKLYADLERLANGAAEREFQIFWANLEVLKPTIYSRPPVPVVVPAFKDRRPLPRRSSEVLERSLVSSFRVEDVHETMKLVRDDLATNARGVAWVRYEAHPSDDGQTLNERVCYEHVDRKDFLHTIARNWKEVDWVARRVWLTRKEGLNRFEEASGKLWLSAEFKAREQDGQECDEGEKKAPVWELWHKGKNCVVWVSPGLDEVLDISEPFLTLEGFFPCPRPAYSTVQRGTLKPVPDMLYYKDQIEEVNELTARISALSESLRLRGFYPGGLGEAADAIEQAIRSTDNNAILIPISSFAAFGNSSPKDSIVWLPVREVAEVITGLITLRKQVIEDIYQITGLSDIMRGSTEASETATAQQLKSQYGSVRIREKQEELVRIARDLAQIAGEIMAENFSPETLLAMSQVDDLPSEETIQQQLGAIQAQVRQIAANPVAREQAQQNPEQAQQIKKQVEAKVQELESTVTVEKVMGLLREQRLRPFILDIETDSTIQPDEDAEKKARTEFVTALAGLLGQIAPFVDQHPDAAPFAGEVIKFATAPYRAGRELESTIDAFIEKMTERASQPKPPSPEEIKAQADAKKSEAEAQAKQVETQARVAEIKLKAQAAAAQHEIDQQKGVLEIQRLQAEIAKIHATPVEGQKPPSESIAFKDLPPEGQVQMAAQAGIAISPDQVVEHEEAMKPEPPQGSSNA